MSHQVHFKPGTREVCEGSGPKADVITKTRTENCNICCCEVEFLLANRDPLPFNSDLVVENGFLSEIEGVSFSTRI
jgi:hypothetical protein